MSPRFLSGRPGLMARDQNPPSVKGPIVQYPISAQGPLVDKRYFPYHGEGKNAYMCKAVVLGQSGGMCRLGGRTGPRRIETRMKPSRSLLDAVTQSWRNVIGVALFRRRDRSS